MPPLLLLAQTAQTSPGVTIPSWAVPVLIGLVLAVLGFAWRLAVKAEKSADKLEAAVKQLESLEHRLAVLAVLERTIAVMERDHAHLTEKVDAQAVEMTRLRDSVHALLRREQGHAP